MHKPIAAISLAVLVALVALASGCGNPGGDSGGSSSVPVAERSNKDTVSTVQQKLKVDKGLAGADIKVSQTGGSISLDGTVASPDQKDRAEKIVIDAQRELKQEPAVLDNLMVKEGGPASSTPANSGG